MNSINCKQLKDYIDQVSFTMNDMVLFLDTHPYDPNALNYYKKLQKMRQQAVDAYSEQCGPLTSDQVAITNYWSWVSTPWPWEMEG